MIEACRVVILGIIEKQLQEKLEAINERRLLNELKNEVDRKVSALMNKNDGTVLTSQAFSEYLENCKPIETIISALCDSGFEPCGVRELEESMPSQCAATIKEKGKSIPATEMDLIKQFFGVVIEVVVKKNRGGSTLGERAIQADLKDVGDSVKQVSAKIDDICDTLERQQSPSVDQEKKPLDILIDSFNKLIQECKIIEIMQDDPLPVMPFDYCKNMDAFCSAVETLLQENILLKEEETYKAIKKFSDQIHDYNLYLGLKMNPTGTDSVAVISVDWCEKMREQIKNMKVRIDKCHRAIFSGRSMFP